MSELYLFGERYTRARGHYVLVILLASICLTTAADQAEGIEKANFSSYDALYEWSVERPWNWPSPFLFDGQLTLSSPASANDRFGSTGAIDFWVWAGWSGELDYNPTLISYQSKNKFGYSIQLAHDAKAIIWTVGPRGFDADDVRVSRLTRFDFSDGKAHHVAWRAGGGKTRFYIDGELQESSLYDPVKRRVSRKSYETVDLRFGSAGGLPFHVGSTLGTERGFIGAIGNVRVWDKALSGKQIRAVMDVAGAPSKSSALRDNLLAFSASFPGTAVIFHRVLQKQSSRMREVTFRENGIAAISSIDDRSIATTLSRDRLGGLR